MSHRILLVDDEPDCIDLLTQVLAEQFEVRAATDGVRALDEVRTFRPHLVITDLGLRGLSGIELARAVRELRPGTLLLAFSGRLAAEVTAEELALFDRFVTKPTSIRRVERAVSELLDHAVPT